ncbi:histone deacetylase [Thermobifida halotolerans]|nr:histone deacetylase [Thermobifida halotolerans]
MTVLPGLVWYVSYGANMAAHRLDHYLLGGCPPGGTRVNPGCRDRTPPSKRRAVWIRGGVYFALESPMWGGGLAVYDPDLPAVTPARAHLVTVSQFGDIAAQEMYRTPGTDLDVAALLERGRLRLGSGRYDLLVVLGALDGRPMVTLAAPWPMASVRPVPPSAAYLRTIASGLAESHGWTAGRIASHLADRPGARGAWTPGEVAALLDGDRVSRTA